MAPFAPAPSPVSSVAKELARTNAGRSSGLDFRTTQKADTIHARSVVIGKIPAQRSFGAKVMRKVIALIILVLAWTGTAIAQSDVKERMGTARAAAIEFGKTLMGELQKAIAAGGPVNAIGVCNVIAPKIAVDISAEKKMTIGRTSLKLRQPNNKPDEWELQQLRRFERRKAAGENPASIEIGEYVTTAGKTVFRYMKPIPTGEVCLNCHGGTLAPEVTAKLKQLYPQDAATGYKLGDLRGAFTITESP